MTRADIINEVEKVFNVRYAWSKSYDNGTMLTEYTLYYNKRARKPLAWLHIGFYALDDSVLGANIIFFKNGERHKIEIETISDINRIISKIYP